MNEARRGVELSTVVGLAWRDLLHERLLGACLIVALAGLLSPLLVLFGLKSGVIETMRGTLLEDPVFRELKPVATDNHTEAFFADLRARPETEFVVESVMRGASTIRAEAATGSVTYLDLLPTGEGDPILAEHGLDAPAEDAVVLSSSAALALGLDATTTGSLELVTMRTDGDRRREGRARMRVHGVLPASAGDVSLVYAPRQLVLDVESFREGFGIPERGWPGETRNVEPVYHGVVVAIDESLGIIARGRLTKNTAFYRVETIAVDAFEHRFGFAPPPAAELLDIRVIDRPAGDESLVRVRRNLAGRLVGAWPYVDGLALDLLLPDESWRRLPVRVVPSEMLADGAVALPGDLDALLPGREPATVRLVGSTAPLVLARTRAAPHGGDAVHLGPRLAGQLQRGLDRQLDVDPTSGELVLRPLGYRSFRLFARRLEDVAPLGAYLSDRDVETQSAVREIRRLQALEAGLASLFWIVAAATLVTAIIVLVASQYGAVERKRVSLAHLRLIGLSRADVAIVPVVQGITIALAGGALGALATWLVCTVINATLAESLGFGRAICVLEPASVVAAVGLGALLALVASSGAAWTATRIDPAEGMRDE